MSLAIAGMGWVTPLGSNVSAVWNQLLGGEEAAPETISSSLNPRSYPAFRVPAAAIDGMPKHARLRRASAISKFAVVAGLAALQDARVEATAERVALIFAISNGGVIYTKRFFHDLVETGARSASPLLFPETVFNAPASHLAAILGITGVSYTLVGDGAVGILALKMAEDLMESETLDYCLVVGAEEVDWLLCDAYHKWRLLRRQPPIEPFSRPPRGTILSEGAGAVLLGRRKGKVAINRISAGGDYPRQKHASDWLRKIFRELEPEKSSLLMASANGTFVDLAEFEAASAELPDALIYSLKGALGESVGASALWQTIAGAQALLTGKVPTNRLLPVHSGKTNDLRCALVSACGLNQQLAGLLLRLED
ncbi:MAG: beta-ketoacyl synthase N-terminal-like domain-containing protein [Verrucomicrobiota bacterium]